MSRSTTVLMFFLVPLIGQAAIVQQKIGLETTQESSCRGNLNSKASLSYAPVLNGGKLHRTHQADIGAMLAMGYSYYGAQRPHRIASARQVLGLGTAKNSRRDTLTTGYPTRARPNAIRVEHCVLPSRIVRIAKGSRHKVGKTQSRRAFS